LYTTLYKLLCYPRLGLAVGWNATREQKNRIVRMVGNAMLWGIHFPVPVPLLALHLLSWDLKADTPTLFFLGCGKPAVLFSSDNRSQGVYYLDSTPQSPAFCPCMYTVLLILAIRVDSAILPHLGMLGLGACKCLVLFDTQASAMISRSVPIYVSSQGLKRPCVDAERSSKKCC